MRLEYLLLLIVAIPMFLSNTDGVSAERKKNKHEGYIVTNDGKKINGFVLVKANLTLDQVKIKFIDFKGKKKTYRAKNIKEYGYRSIKTNEAGNRDWMWTYYESRNVDEAPIPFGPKQVFMERLVQGDATLFEYWIQVNSNIENPYKRYFYLERDSERVKLTRENFVTKAQLFFSDHSEIVNMMGKVNHRFRHMERVTKKYNNWKKRQADVSF